MTLHLLEEPELIKKMMQPVSEGKGVLEGTRPHSGSAPGGFCTLKVFFKNLH